MTAVKERFVIGNWKMNLSVAPSIQLATDIAASNAVKKIENSNVHCWIAPSFLSIGVVAATIHDSIVQVGSQNLCPSEKGAFTGEISAEMLKDVGGTFAIVGHSERRTLYFEDDSLIAERTVGCLNGGITPIVCIGETLEEREQGRTEAILESQLLPVLAKISGKTETVLFAYEPKWAIGTGRNATTETIQTTHSAILSIIGSNRIRGLLYGGSVTPENFGEIIAIDGVDGALVGGASLKAESFLDLVEIAALQE